MGLAIMSVSALLSAVMTPLGALEACVNCLPA
jgi:hypothetical protein